MSLFFNKNNLPKSQNFNYTFDEFNKNQITSKAITKDELEKIKEEMNKAISLASKNHELNDKIIEFMQDEQNSAEFYLKLSDVCREDKYRADFKKISDDCLQKVKDLNKIYFEFNNKNYALKPKNIVPIFDFKQSLVLALQEETKACSKILSFIENCEHKIKQDFYLLVFSKMNRINFIQSIIIIIDKI